jgi:diguanylate cyclase (GGDEF)-like protein/PAS domain S-box-containing protein
MTLVGSAVVVIGYLAHLQGEFKRSTEFLSSVINTIPDPIYVKNKNHHKIVINEAYCKLVGYPINTLMSKSDYELFPQQEADVFWQQDELAFYRAGEQENEEKLTNAQGITHFIATKRSLHRDGAGNIFLVGVIRDITERKRLEEELKRIAAELERYNAQLKVHAEQDPLTGLANRKVFYDRLEQSLEWAKNNNKLVALLYLDLNDFKLINDTLGHHIGDLVLKTVAQRLQGCLRSSDMVARLGGDEFTVILPGIPRKSDVTRVADKILHTITQNTQIEGHSISITTSIGVSVYPLDTQDLNDLIQKADQAMYRAKRLGKNRYEFAISQSHQKVNQLQ